MSHLPCRKSLANRFGFLLRIASLLILLGLWIGAALAQQPLAGGADLFAASYRSGKEVDAGRALLALREGAAEFLTKPFNDAVLLEIFHAAVDRWGND